MSNLARSKASKCVTYELRWGRAPAKIARDYGWRAVRMGQKHLKIIGGQV
jgi:hypothetical protein